MMSATSSFVRIARLRTHSFIPASFLAVSISGFDFPRLLLAQYSNPRLS